MARSKSSYQRLQRILLIGACDSLGCLDTPCRIWLRLEEWVTTGIVTCFQLIEAQIFCIFCGLTGRQIKAGLRARKPHLARWPLALPAGEMGRLTNPPLADSGVRRCCWHFAGDLICGARLKENEVARKNNRHGTHDR